MWALARAWYLLSKVEEQSLLSAVFDAAPDAILVVDGQGRIVLANHASEVLFGYPREDLLGEPVERLLPDALRARHVEHRAAYAAAPRARSMGAGLALTAHVRDGRDVPVEISLSPVAHDARGLVVVIVRDVCERTGRETALRESERRFHAIFDAAFQLISLLSPTGTVVLANHAALEMVGVPATEVVGRPFWETVWWRHSPSEQQRVRDAVAAAGGGEFVRFETTHSRQDGTLATVDFSLKPIVDASGAVDLLVAEGRDVSEREELRRSFERLRDDLTQMVVHDLKSPVAGILMTLQLTRRKFPDLARPLQRNLGQVEAACNEMTRLIQNLLDVSRLEEGKMPVTLEPVPLAEIVRSVVGDYSALAEQVGRRVELAVPDATAAVADPALVKRVLVNLVVNALRHSGARVVRIETAPGCQEPATVTLRVRDDGRGIPAGEQAHIFEKFVSRSGPGGGDTGLGLPFCKLAVERMGGRIDLHSEEGRGSVFSVQLPASS